MGMNLVVMNQYAALNWRGTTSANTGSIRCWLRTRCQLLKWFVHVFLVIEEAQGGILADYDQVDTHVLKWNPHNFGYQFIAAYWLITTKTSFVGGTLLTQSFSFLDDRETLYDRLYNQTSCSEPTPLGPHIGCSCVTSDQGGILADYDQVDTHVRKWNPHKFGYPKSIHIRAACDWDIPSKLRLAAIYPSVAILASRQFLFEE